MHFSKNTFISVVSIITSITLFFFLLLGVLSFSMAMEHQMQSGDCVFMIGESGLCAMNGQYHISLWKMLFNAIPSPQLFIIVSFAYFFSSITSFLEYVARFSKYMKLKWRIQSLKNSLLKLFSPLEQLLSRGILHPKLYAKVRVKA